MKRWIIGLIVIILISGGCWVGFALYPRTIDTTLQGVKYQLGPESESFGIEPATINIQGKLHTSLTGKRVFKGEIAIVGEEIPVPADQRSIAIHFFDNGWGAMMYPYFIYNEQGATQVSKVYTSHGIFANKDFSQVTLLIVEPVEDGRTHWSSKNGVMVSAPAVTREEALALTNELMRDFQSEPLH